MDWEDLPVLPDVVEPELRGPDANHAPERDEDRDDVRHYELHVMVQYTLIGPRWLRRTIFFVEIFQYLWIHQKASVL